MRSTVLRSSVAAATALLLVTGSAASARIRPPERAINATRFIAANQTSDGSFEGSFSPIGTAADAVVALSAARRAPGTIDAALDYLETNVDDADTVGLKSKVVMAAVAGGRDPRAFGGRDLVKEIRESVGEDGQYGEHTNAPGDPEVFDHALAILALAGAGEGIVPEQVFTWLISAQCDDGGWQFDDPAGENDDNHCHDGTEGDFSRSDTNTTAIAVQALQVAVDSRRPPVSPFRFFAKTRDPEKRGWGYDLTLNLTDANSTALVIQAHVAVGRDLPRGAMRALTRLQYPNCGDNAGAFAFTWERDASGSGELRRGEPNVAATIGAVLGLLRQPLPLPRVAATKPPPRSRPC
ncbi:MAG TPA: hypothetical protein VNC78_11335 [Actinomycetota bacterium]|nr:hypothetical protein [Actinomycetota bacterium]